MRACDLSCNAGQRGPGRLVETVTVLRDLDDIAAPLPISNQPSPGAQPGALCFCRGGAAQIIQEGFADARARVLTTLEFKRNNGAEQGLAEMFGWWPFDQLAPGLQQVLAGGHLKTV